MGCDSCSFKTRGTLQEIARSAGVDPEVMRQIRADKGRAFDELNLSLLPVLQEPALRLDVPNQPPQG